MSRTSDLSHSDPTRVLGEEGNTKGRELSVSFSPGLDIHCLGPLWTTATSTKQMRLASKIPGCPLCPPFPFLPLFSGHKLENSYIFLSQCFPPRALCLLPQRRYSLPPATRAPVKWVSNTCPPPLLPARTQPLVLLPPRKTPMVGMFVSGPEGWIETLQPALAPQLVVALPRTGGRGSHAQNIPNLVPPAGS